MPALGLGAEQAVCATVHYEADRRDSHYKANLRRGVGEMSLRPLCLREQSPDPPALLLNLHIRFHAAERAGP